MKNKHSPVLQVFVSKHKTVTMNQRGPIHSYVEVYKKTGRPPTSKRLPKSAHCHPRRVEAVLLAPSPMIVVKEEHGSA